MGRWIKYMGRTRPLTRSPGRPGIPGAPATPLSPYSHLDTEEMKPLQEFYDLSWIIF